MIRRVKNMYRRFLAVRGGYDVYKDVNGVWVATRNLSAGSNAKMPLECVEDLRRSQLW